jgi:hypothetical protein
VHSYGVNDLELGWIAVLWQNGDVSFTLAGTGSAQDETRLGQIQTHLLVSRYSPFPSFRSFISVLLTDEDGDR